MNNLWEKTNYFSSSEILEKNRDMIREYLSENVKWYKAYDVSLSQNKENTLDILLTDSDGFLIAFQWKFSNNGIITNMETQKIG